MTKVQSFSLLRTALAGESGDAAATPLSFPHINQEEANQAKFNRKEHCQHGWSYLPSAQPSSRLCIGWWSSSRAKGWGWSWALHSSEPLLEQGLVQSSNSEPTSGKWRLLPPKNQNRKEGEREREWGRGEERKEQRKNKKSGREKEREGPLNVTSPALWNGFSLMLTTWYLLSI